MTTELAETKMSLVNNGSAQKVVKICYTEKTRNLNFRIQTADLKDLKECVKIIDQYNEFDHKTVNEYLDTFADYKKFYNEGNPNNGQDLFVFEIGRESSPAMYIKYRNTFNDDYQTPDGELKKMSVEQFKTNMKVLAQAIKADECDFTDGWETECRLWWD